MFVIVGRAATPPCRSGPEGPLVVDAQPAALSGAVLDAVRSLTPQPIRHIVLTSGDDQAAGGAATTVQGRPVRRVIDSIDPRGSRHARVDHRPPERAQPDERRKAPTDIWPTDTYFTPEWSLFSNGEAVQLFHMPAATPTATRWCSSAAPTSSPPARSSTRRRYPRFDPDRGGSIAGIIEALNRVIEICRCRERTRRAARSSCPAAAG